MRDKNLSVECSVLQSAPKQSETEVAVRCKNEAVTVFVSALCPEISKCFLLCALSCISLLGYAVVIIVWRFTVGLLINGTVISAR